MEVVNRQTDRNGVNYARKAMIRCGLSRDVTGKWHEKQLSVELQNIITKYRDEFLAGFNPGSSGQQELEGTEGADGSELDGSESEEADGSESEEADGSESESADGLESEEANGSE